MKDSKGDVIGGKKAAQGYQSAYNRRSKANAVRWGEVHAGAVLDALDAVQSAGDALLLGATRDGGALVITVCSGDQRHKFYPTSTEECEATLLDITNAALGKSGAT